MIKTVIMTACNNYNSNNDNNNSRDRSNLNGTKNGQTEICIEVQVLLTEKKNTNDNNKSMSNKTMKRIRAKVGLVLDGYAHWKLELSKIISCASCGNFHWSTPD